MRDEKRIDEILELVGKIWRQSPDMRFNQLMIVLQNKYCNDNGLRDAFNLEDDRFKKFLEAQI